MKALLCGFLFCFCILAYADESSTLNVPTDAPNFEVTLAANATTGFQWSIVSYDKSLLTLSKSYYERPNTNLIGAGGQMHYLFALIKGKKYPASTELVFKYSRSWEPDSATIQKVQVHFIP